MDTETGKWVGRLVVTVFGGAFVLTVVMMAVSGWSKVKGWWRDR